MTPSEASHSTASSYAHLPEHGPRSENPMSRPAARLPAQPSADRGTQSVSHFSRRFRGPFPPNSHAMKSVKHAPRGDEARQSDAYPAPRYWARQGVNRRGQLRDFPRGQRCRIPPRFRTREAVWPWQCTYPRRAHSCQLRSWTAGDRAPGRFRLLPTLTPQILSR